MQADYGGIVYIEAEYAYSTQDPIEGHWEPSEGADFVYGPGWTTASEAISWGRYRAPWVILRVHSIVHPWRHAWVDGLPVRLPAPPEHRTVQYSAGEAYRAHEEYVRWPTASERRDDDVAGSYGGTVWLVQEGIDSWRGEQVGYTARWEAESGGALRPQEIAGPAWMDDLAAAIEWARDRAPYVLVYEPGVGYESAGVRELTGLNLPRLDWIDEPEPEPLPDGPLVARIDSSFTGEWTQPKSFPIPEGLEPAGGLPSD